MYYQTGTNAIAAIRVSSVRQGTDGDSPEAQKEQIERFAAARNITIKKFFVFLESASKEQQPMQEAIDYCKNPDNHVALFIIKSIDRFTRGGSYSYDQLKNQLDHLDIGLTDIHGIISSQKINTMDHLGFEYRWSVYSPSKKSEMLEAERAKDELRDIMSRVIGAEVRYTQMGYWMRKPPYGFKSEKVETRHGKRCILMPHETEAALIIKMFELRAQRTLDDHQITDELNRMGYKSRVELLRSKIDRTQVVGQRGGHLLTAKALNKIIRNPLYAGIIKEKWTQNKPIKAQFNGLVSFELYNQANRGKLKVVECADGDIEIEKEQPADHLVKKGVRNIDFPYKQFVACPHCQRPLLGSASRGKMGKYYPAYHCSNHGHYFRVPKAEFEQTISSFVDSLVIAPEQQDALLDATMAIWNKRRLSALEDNQAAEKRIQELYMQMRSIVDKMRMLNSETAVKYMEEDLVKIEKQITVLESNKVNVPSDTKDMPTILQYVKYFMEHLKELLINSGDPINKAAYFSVLFDQVPTYQQLKDGTQKIAQIPGVNELFSVAQTPNDFLVIPRGIEPRLPG